MSERRTIKVDYLARVEGEGALYLRIRDGQVEDVRLEIFEPPRFFEALLQGRSFTEAPDITARICGICPVAYQMSAVHAMERALAVTVSPEVRALRRLLYCGEWIESHVLHVYMLHAPDFLGFDGVVDMAAQHREAVERGLRLKKAGNAIVSAVGGREIHPINVRVGGFYRAPDRSRLRALLDELRWGRDAALESVRWVAGFDMPELERDYELVALRHPDEYPMNEGRLVSSGGLDADVSEFEEHVREIHVERSNALHAELIGRGPYFVGPMARFGLNFEQLAPVVREAAREVGLEPPCRNPFRSIVIRCLEVLQAFDEAIRIVEAYEPPAPPATSVEPRAGTGWAATEAPRGLLYHRYTVAGDGTITEATIVPPTSQNQRTIEDDLRAFVPAYAHLGQDQLTWKCEQAIRSYDPCISCATHFLDLELIGDEGDERARVDVARRAGEPVSEGRRRRNPGGAGDRRPPRGRCRGARGGRRGLELVELLRERDRVLVVDAVRSGERCGTVHHFVVAGPGSTADGAFPAGRRGTSTHGAGLAEAVSLARVLGVLPRELIVYGIEGREFGHGETASPEVEAAARALAERLAGELAGRAASSSSGRVDARRCRGGDG